MSGFQVPFSSSPAPSTPDRRSGSGNKNYFGDNNPSTTPAGPPPSSAGSFTPAGLPPSSVFGSSQLGAHFDSQPPLAPIRFSKQSTYNSSNSLFGSPKLPSQLGPKPKATGNLARSGLSNEFTAPSFGSRPGDLLEDDDAEGDYEDGYGDSQEEGSDEHNGQYTNEEEYSDDADAMAEDDGQEGFHGGSPEFQDSQFNSSGPIPNSTSRGRYNPSESLNQSIGGSAPFSFSRQQEFSQSQGSLQNLRYQRPKESTFGKMAKETYSRMGPAKLSESDSLILGTEDLISRLYEEGISREEDDEALKRALAAIPVELFKLWTDYNDNTTVYASEEYTATIGPGPKASKFSNANFLASLLLRLHSPMTVTQSAEFSQSMRSSLRQMALPPAKAKPIPMLLLEWMDEYHAPSQYLLEVVRKHQPSSASHTQFWPCVLNSLLRGRIFAAIGMLRDAGWGRTISAGRSDFAGSVYSGQVLKNIDIVINDAIQALSLCPGTNGDWNIRSSDWTLFRLKISQALENLKIFAEGRDKARQPENFQNSAMSNSQSMTANARRAQSQVPWAIYQQLLAMYNLVLGHTLAITENAQDWCEATVGLVVWWNPGNDDRRLAASRTRLLDGDSDSELYLDKLSEAFYTVNSESSSLQINTLNPIEVGLACIFESDVGAVIALLRALSGPVSAAVVELGSLGGWLPQVDSQSLIVMDSLDQDDMDVLGLGSSEKPGEDLKDATLVDYANALMGRVELRSSRRGASSQESYEGWELAIMVLGRLNSAQQSEEEVSYLLDGFHFESSTTVDKLLRLLNDISLTKQAKDVAEHYADSLAEQSFKYGEALWYYALAHKSQKVKDVLDLLISFSLIHSVSYPPLAELDPYLKRLISTPKEVLLEMSKTDYDAAQLLHKMLSGYATLRRFYDLRDAEINLPPGQKPKVGSVTRRREAAAALMTVIASADDNIRGGLYDESRGAVVSVDFILALLGEAMVFIPSDEGMTSTQIYTLLKSIEDIQTVAPRVRKACDEFFETVLASTRGMKGSTPMDLLKKSTSSLSGGSFSLVGSSMLASQLHRSASSSGVLVKGDVKRGWDWRSGLEAGMTSEDVLKMFRFGLAKELAKVSIAES